MTGRLPENLEQTIKRAIHQKGGCKMDYHEGYIKKISEVENKTVESLKEDIEYMNQYLATSITKDGSKAILINSSGTFPDLTPGCEISPKWKDYFPDKGYGIVDIFDTRLWKPPIEKKKKKENVISENGKTLSKLIEILARMYRVNPKLTTDSIKADYIKIMTRKKIDEVFPGLSKDGVRNIYSAMEEFQKNVLNLSFFENLERVCENKRIDSKGLYSILQSKKSLRKLKL
jgi:hypothetical protein